MESPLDFKLFQPKKELSTYIQGIWSAAVSPDSSGNVKRWLQGDACSGIIFNLGENIRLNDSQFSEKIILLPISMEAHSITLFPGAQLAGIRFHPGIGTGVFGAQNDKPMILTDCNQLQGLQSTIVRLEKAFGHQARIAVLYKWLKNRVDFSEVIPKSLLHSMSILKTAQKNRVSGSDIPLSQRQIERQFQQWVGMSPKRYQRILRVYKAINFLKHNPDTNLVTLALNNGFSDQAHMTREFNHIAKITPKRYSKRIVSR